jgi:hypothetical protein
LVDREAYWKVVEVGGTPRGNPTSLGGLAMDVVEKGGVYGCVGAVA